jgi:predicted DNA-binding transcriptional regulator AlpA
MKHGGIDMACVGNIQLAGRRFESAKALKERTGMAETTLYLLMQEKNFPRPVRIARYRYFDPVEVDNWFISNRR